MSKRDAIHQIVRTALEKDGWKITEDPLVVKLNEIELRIDLGAERVLAAEKAGQKIAIEIKSFVGQSTISDFHLALGQTLTYRSALRKTEPSRTLYLAISEDIYQEFFINQFIQDIIQEYEVKLAIFNLPTQEIALWKE